MQWAADAGRAAQCGCCAQAVPSNTTALCAASTPCCTALCPTAHREEVERGVGALVEEEAAAAAGDDNVPGEHRARRAHQRGQQRVGHEHLPRALSCQLAAQGGGVV